MTTIFNIFRERKELRDEVSRLKHQLHDLCELNHNLPEGCERGKHCKVCRHALLHTVNISPFTTCDYYICGIGNTCEHFRSKYTTAE